MVASPSEIRYAPTRDGIDIAYQVMGEGPTDLVFVSGFVSHLDLNQDFPPYQRTLRLAGFARLVMFDKRGTGLSDRTLGFGSLEDRMDDIRAVMDAAGIDRAALFGVSEGGPLALLFAATYPERVSRLAVYGSIGWGSQAPDSPAAPTTAQMEDAIRFMSDHWGTGHAMRLTVQGAPDEALPILARFERNACTRHMVEEIMRRNFEIDIRPMLSAVRVPTLVAHNVGDPLVPVEQGRCIGSRVPGARYVEGPDQYHGYWDPAEGQWLAEALLDFLFDETVLPAPERVLETIVFTDIVGSTEKAAQLGDAEWRALLDRHDHAAREHVARFGGQVVKTTGDGVLATFSGPSRGVEFARTLRESVKPLGVGIRAGVHTGEVERRGDDVGGIGVHIAARVAALAGDGEVWVSRTVRDLTAGSGLEFDPQGARALKGVPDEWEVYRYRG